MVEDDLPLRVLLFSGMSPRGDCFHAVIDENHYPCERAAFFFDITVRKHFGVRGLPFLEPRNVPVESHLVFGLSSVHPSFPTPRLALDHRRLPLNRHLNTPLLHHTDISVHRDHGQEKEYAVCRAPISSTVELDPCFVLGHRSYSSTLR